jgi:hypothetical protein
MMFHFARRMNLSDLVSPRGLGIGLLCLAVLLGLGARPAFAQALTRQQIHRLLAQRRLQAAAVNIKIQREQVLLTRLQTIAFPSFAIVLRIATLQNDLNNDLNTIQTLDNQIVLLNQLLALLDQMDAVNLKIRGQERRIAELQRLRQGFVVQQRIANLQTNIQNLQTTLATIQGQIDTIQSQLIP